MNVEVFWTIENGMPHIVPLNQCGATSECLICEIQVQLRCIQEIKDRGSHERYISWRDLLTA